MNLCDQVLKIILHFCKSQGHSCRSVLHFVFISKVGLQVIFPSLFVEIFVSENMFVDGSTELRFKNTIFLFYIKNNLIRLKLSYYTCAVLIQVAIVHSETNVVEIYCGMPLDSNGYFYLSIPN